jgi:hypothetical protein
VGDRRISRAAGQSAGLFGPGEATDPARLDPGDAAAAAARVEADKLRVEFEAKFRSATAPAAAPARPRLPPAEGGREVDGLRSLRDTERDSDPDAPNGRPRTTGTSWGPGRAADVLRGDAPPPAQEPARARALGGVDYLAKKWDISEAEVIGALKECGLEIPEDEDAKVTCTWTTTATSYWVNVNRRGELWVNTKEKSRPVFRTVQADAGRARGGAGPAEPRAGRSAKPRAKARRRPSQEATRRPPRRFPRARAPRQDPAPHAQEPPRAGRLGQHELPFPRPQVQRGGACRRVRRDGALAPRPPGDPPVFVEIGDESWWLNKDSRGGIWINAREKRADEAPGAPLQAPGRGPRAGQCALPPSASS